jgi:hypothetical protein
VTPTVANRVGQTPSTNFDDAGFATGTYFYVVTAQDANGNIGVKSNEVQAAATADVLPPTVAVTVPAPDALLSGTVTLTATASDDVGVTGVQFLLDGASYGAEELAAPYAIDWNTVLASNGAHTVSARARDARGNLTTATTVPVGGVERRGLRPRRLLRVQRGGGGAALDSSGASNHGTVTNAAWTASGHTLGALSFDGTTDYVRATSSSTLNGVGSGLTIEMWANITGSAATDYVLLAKPWTAGTTGNPPYQYGIEYDANGLHTLDFYFGDTTNTKRGPYSITPLLGTWTHLAFTFDGTTVKGYLDGVLKISSPQTATIQSRATDLLIGVDGALSQGFNGRLDDVRLYNRALSQLEIQTDMGRPVSPAIPPGARRHVGTVDEGDAYGRRRIDDRPDWDVSGCTAKGYHAVYGPLANVSTLEIGGGVCGMGTSGVLLVDVGRCGRPLVRGRRRRSQRDRRVVGQPERGRRDERIRPVERLRDDQPSQSERLPVVIPCKTTVISRGPWTPMTSFFSMSAVLDGPQMLIIRPRRRKAGARPRRFQRERPPSRARRAIETTGSAQSVVAAEQDHRRGFRDDRIGEDTGRLAVDPLGGQDSEAPAWRTSTAPLRPDAARRSARGPALNGDLLAARSGRGV